LEEEKQKTKHLQEQIQELTRQQKNTRQNGGFLDAMQVKKNYVS
jgi:hypothetical protein